MVGSLPCNSERKHRHMAPSDTCPRCSTQAESIMHTLHDCVEVREFQSTYIPSSQWAKFFSLGMHGWIHFNFSTKDIHTNSADWSSFFGVVVYYIWSNRNKLVFSNQSELHSGLHYQVMVQVNLIFKYSINPPLSQWQCCLWGHHQGPQWQCGSVFRFKINFEMDSMVVVQIVQTGQFRSQFLVSLVRDIRKLLMLGEFLSCACQRLSVSLFPLIIKKNKINHQFKALFHNLFIYKSLILIYY